MKTGQLRLSSLTHLPTPFQQKLTHQTPTLTFQSAAPALQQLGVTGRHRQQHGLHKGGQQLRAPHLRSERWGHDVAGWTLAAAAA